MSEIDEVLEAARQLGDGGEPVGLATVVSVRGSSYRRPGARLLVPRDSTPVGLISGGCLEDEAARLARRAIDEDVPLLVTIDHSHEGDELWGSGLGCRGAIDLLAEPPSLAAETLDALAAARSDGRATYLLTGLDGERERLTARQADALGERAARAVAYGRPALIGETVLDPILPPLHLVVCGAGPDAGPLVAAGIRQGWRADVVDPRRSWLRAERFPGARLHAAVGRGPGGPPRACRPGPRSRWRRAGRHLDRGRDPDRLPWPIRRPPSRPPRTDPRLVSGALRIYAIYAAAADRYPPM